MNNLKIFNKPSGFSSHSANKTDEGWIEYCSRTLKKKLWLCHRLDKETSGALLMVSSKEASRQVYELFVQKKIVKKYLFVTDRKSVKDAFLSESIIEKKGVRADSASKSPNAATSFRLQKENGRYFLWEALPHTGKTHQIRIHAKEAGIPILGDIVYGGTDFFRLMLHSEQIELPWEGKVQQLFVPTPTYFTHLDLLEDLELSQLLHSFKTREALFPRVSLDTIRFVHTEHPWLRCDKLGDVLWFSSFHPEKNIEEIVSLIERLQQYIPFDKFIVRLMANRGHSPHKLVSSSSANLPTEWIAREESWKFIIKTDHGSSSGIFLDQRQNRKWVYDHSSNKTVLNLYSYTSLFSVVAALGGAKEVVSVDVSKTTLQWAKENFTLNMLDPDQYEFWAIDSENFLKGCSRRKRFFDLIVCDPPSFSRSKKKVFKIEKKIAAILTLCHRCLTSNGRILFSSNLEKCRREDFLKEIPQKLFLPLPPPIPDYDFELPGQQKILKTFLLKKQKN